jgi:hypothetical protein
LAELANCGIVAGPVETIGDAVGFAIITNPDGSRLKVGEPSS